MSSQSFPLLNLPYLALVHVVRMFGVKELVSLSLISNRMKFIVKHYRNKSLPLHLSLIGSFHPTVVLREQDNFFNFVRIIVKPLLTTRPDELQGAHRDEDEYVTYWNNEVRGTKFLLDSLCDLFGIIVKEVTLEGNEVWMLDLVEKMQGSSYVAKVMGDEKLSNDEFRHILLNLNPTSLIIGPFHSNDDFKIENFHKKYQTLFLFQGTWITMDNLLQLDCIELTITEKNFTSQEMERYIRHVLTGGANRLRSFSAEVDDHDVILALEAMLELSTGEEEIHVNFRSWELITKKKREDGMVKISIEYGFYHHVIALTVEELAE